jgi:hypothetical protein
MSLRDEIQANYTDANGLICNRKCTKDEVNPSGNGVCYTGEYIAILKARGEPSLLVNALAIQALWKCWNTGPLSRGPGQFDTESVDDYYGLAATQFWMLNKTALDYGFQHWGSFNNIFPYSWTFTFFLWRQPQLLYAMACSAGVIRNPVYWPFGVYTALVIATACVFGAKTDWDSWRLTWLLIQTVSPHSCLCRQAAKLWWRRLRKAFGNEGMRAVYAGYFGPQHPFAKYAVNAWELKTQTKKED